MKLLDFFSNSGKVQTDIFSKRFRVLLGSGIFLTGLVSLAGILFTADGIYLQIWEETGMCQFIQKVIPYMCIWCCFSCMIMMQIQKRFYSKFLVRCVQMIGGIFTVSSFLLPHLSGYRSRGFEIMKIRTFLLIDGWYLLLGIIVLIFAGIIKEGFYMQKELDEVL